MQRISSLKSFVSIVRPRGCRSGAVGLREEARAHGRTPAVPSRSLQVTRRPDVQAPTDQFSTRYAAGGPCNAQRPRRGVLQVRPQPAVTAARVLSRDAERSVPKSEVETRCPRRTSRAANPTNRSPTIRFTRRPSSRFRRFRSTSIPPVIRTSADSSPRTCCRRATPCASRKC